MLGCDWRGQAVYGDVERIDSAAQDALAGDRNFRRAGKAPDPALAGKLADER
jgi:hypothetical protein